MLLLLMNIGDDFYAIDIDRIVEIVPFVNLKKIPQMPRYIGGILNYRGRLTPVVDISELLAGRPTPPLFSSRIILVRYRGVDGENHTLGLLAGAVTETINVNPEQIQSSGIEVENAPFLKDIIIDERGMIQRIDIDKTLPKNIHEALFRSGEGDA
ncbi:MAG: chemotaxis protein CheW [Candidatus Kapaibacterium sp.]